MDMGMNSVHKHMSTVSFWDTRSERLRNLHVLLYRSFILLVFCEWPLSCKESLICWNERYLHRFIATKNNSECSGFRYIFQTILLALVIISFSGRKHNNIEIAVFPLAVMSPFHFRVSDFVLVDYWEQGEMAGRKLTVKTQFCISFLYICTLVS